LRGTPLQLGIYEKLKKKNFSISILFSPTSGACNLRCNSVTSGPFSGWHDVTAHFERILSENHNPHAKQLSRHVNMSLQVSIARVPLTTLCESVLNHCGSLCQISMSQEGWPLSRKTTRYLRTQTHTCTRDSTKYVIGCLKVVVKRPKVSLRCIST